ncbi:MAG: HAMP domain-containing sensor histidine kinase [Steroidobacteraceae bacterium]
MAQVAGGGVNSKGAISELPRRRLRVAAILGAAWLVFLIALGGWWVSIVMRQSSQIAELELAGGMAESAVDAKWEQTRRMLFWESSTFLLLLLTLSALLFWLYWREYRRTRAMQAFFAAVTHELRTPLTSVRLQAEALALTAGENQPSAELTRRLLDDTHRLESQIDKALELARMEGGGSLAEQEIPLNPWLERVLGSMAQVHGARVQIATHIAADLPPIRGDAAAVQMILRNQLENSVRHAQRTPVQVNVDARANAAGVEILYRDDGGGSSEPHAALGKLFQRGGASSGTGVGLYLTRVLMERMGGRVAFGTAANGGFETRLQFQRGPEATV